VKLNEALAERADVKRRLDQMKHRVIAAARHQEGEDPPESADELLSQAGELLGRQRILITRINHTNAEAVTEDGESVTAALARRDELRSLHKLVTETEQAAAGTGRHDFYRATRGEIRDVTEMDVVALRRRADEIARQVRELDAQIQAAGLAFDLVDH
jgi:hypothetical protein